MSTTSIRGLLRSRPVVARRSSVDVLSLLTHIRLPFVPGAEGLIDGPAGQGPSQQAPPSANPSAGSTQLHNKYQHVPLKPPPKKWFKGEYICSCPVLKQQHLHLHFGAFSRPFYPKYIFHET